MLRASSGYFFSDPPPAEPARRRIPEALKERAGWAAQGLAIGLAGALLAWPAATFLMKQLRPAPVAVAKHVPPSPVQPVVQAPAPVPRTGTADFGKTKVSKQARQLAQWVMAGWDHNGRPFAILDKRQARVLVFNADGKLQATTPVPEWGGQPVRMAQEEDVIIQIDTPRWAFQRQVRLFLVRTTK